MKSMLTLLAAALSISLAGAQAKKFDPYTLLSAAEAKAIMGKPFKRAPESPGLSSAYMAQYLEDSDRLMTESLTIQVHLGGLKEFPGYVKMMRTDLGLRPQPVKGIGQKAVFAEGQLVVLQGKHFFIVMIGRHAPDAERQRLAVAIAKKVLPRLPR